VIRALGRRFFRKHLTRQFLDHHQQRRLEQQARLRPTEPVLHRSGSGTRLSLLPVTKWVRGLQPMAVMRIEPFLARQNKNAPEQPRQRD
jgi:hypothetical protein